MHAHTAPQLKSPRITKRKLWTRTRTSGIHLVPGVGNQKVIGDHSLMRRHHLAPFLVLIADHQLITSANTSPTPPFGPRCRLVNCLPLNEQGRAFWSVSLFFSMLFARTSLYIESFSTNPLSGAATNPAQFIERILIMQSTYTMTYGKPSPTVTDKQAFAPC